MLGATIADDDNADDVKAFSGDRGTGISRRGFVQGSMLAAGAALLPPAALASHVDADDLFEQLDRKILAGMRALDVPDVSVAVIHRGKQYVRGYGVLDVRRSKKVGAATVFRIASNSKVFAGTTAMRLVDEGLLDLDRPVRHYVADFRPPRGAEGVTVREVLNHSAGWLGYDYHDTGTDKQALARYVRDIHKLRQLTPVGRTFSYSNAAISVAGRVIETITGKSFEASVRRLVLEPLGMSDSGYNAAIVGQGNQGDATWRGGRQGRGRSRPALPAAQLQPVRRAPVQCGRHGQVPPLPPGRRPGRPWPPPDEQGFPAGGWNRVGPGGTLIVEPDGAGVSWMVRPTAEGPVVVHHGGDLPGFHSGLLMVPEKQFAMAMLTNSDSGPLLVAQFFYQDCALRRFAGVSNLPA